MNEKKTKHFDMRMTPSEARALEILAKREGISKSQVIINFIRAQAAKKGIPV